MAEHARATPMMATISWRIVRPAKALPSMLRCVWTSWRSTGISSSVFEERVLHAVARTAPWGLWRPKQISYGARDEREALHPGPLIQLHGGCQCPLPKPRFGRYRRIWPYGWTCLWTSGRGKKSRPLPELRSRLCGITWRGWRIWLEPQTKGSWYGGGERTGCRGCDGCLIACMWTRRN